MTLKSKFARKNEKFKANKIFTDRTAPQTVFAQSIAQILTATQEEQSRQIVTFYGKGGIGKTSLLKQIQKNSIASVYEAYPQYTFRNVSISLEAFDYANPINVLTAIRSMVEGDCSLFDYALMQYYSKARVSMEEIKSKNTFLSPVVMELLNEAIDICTASVSIPKTLLEKGISFIQDMQFRAKYKEDIQEIAELTEFDIFERLPYYLALCINHSAHKNVIHILFLDSYESTQARMTGATSSVDGVAWLKELFLACERTLFVIASRDRLNWERQDADWGVYLNQHLLSNLSDEDSRWFLEQVPIQDAEDTINQIIHHAGGVPLYLDLCVDLYENGVNEGQRVDFSNFNGSATIIDRYMRHLKEKDRYAVSALSTLKSFDRGFGLKVLEKRNLIYHMDEIDSLLEKSVFLSLSGGKDLWKVDESVRQHIYEQMPTKWKMILLEDALEVILENRSGAMYPYFATALETVRAHPAYMDPIRDKLFEALEYFGSIGYWNELRILLKDQLSCADSGVRALAGFAELIWLRRTGNLAEAAAFGENNPLQQADMGVWHYMYRFYQTHVLHLMGNYDQSLLRYRELLEEMDLVKNLIPTHIYNTIAIKYADLLFLKGEFDTALEMTEKMLSDPGTLLSDTIELLRIKGHIFRFRKKYREAETIYTAALKLTREHDLRSLEGKLYTNLAEVNCLTDPEVAMTWYEKALEKNVQMNNEIEVGKAHTAASVAMTTSGQSAQGERLARTAIVNAENTGYRSGKLFALLALAYAQQQGQNQQQQTLQQASALSEQLGVYRFLLPEESV